MSEKPLRASTCDRRIRLSLVLPPPIDRFIIDRHRVLWGGIRGISFFTCIPSEFYRVLGIDIGFL